MHSIIHNGGRGPGAARRRTRNVVGLGVIAASLVACGCGGEGEAPRPNGPPPATTATKSPFAAETAPAAIDLKPDDPRRFEKALAAHYKGVGYMERYEYAQAAAAFRTVVELLPDWLDARVNLAIALLNDTGVKVEENKKKGGDAEKTNFDEALGLLDAVIKKDPDNLRAHYCRGIILRTMGDKPEAHREFRYVVDRDPTDAHAWCELASTLTDPDEPLPRPSRKQSKELVAMYRKALEINPYLVEAIYRLQDVYRLSGDRAGQKEMLQTWMKLNPASHTEAPGEPKSDTYGEAGRYVMIVDPAPRSGVVAEVPRTPRFEPPKPIDAALPAGVRWVQASDFPASGADAVAVIGRARARFGAAVAAFDANGDGKLDLYLAAAARGPKGVRDVLLLNEGEGKFVDASAAWGVSDGPPSLGVAAGDFDADKHVDVYLTGVGGNRLLRNTGARFEDRTAAAGVAGAGGVSVTARWLDLDQDGDLDLYVVNYCDAKSAADAFTGKPVTGLANAAYRNDGEPPDDDRPRDNWAPLAVSPFEKPKEKGLSIQLRAWPAAEGLVGGATPHTAAAALDLDGDRDLDLLLASDGEPLVAVINDRLGRFHAIPLRNLKLEGPVSSLAVVDFDNDGRTDVAACVASGRAGVWRNLSKRTEQGSRMAFEAWPTNAEGWRSACAADFELNGRFALVGLTSSTPPNPAWARLVDGTRVESKPVALGPESVDQPRLDGCAYADVVGDALPDFVLVGAGGPPRTARNLGNGNHWLALSLAGRWKVQPDHMRTNAHGLGARLRLDAANIQTSYEHTTPDAGPAQSVAPVVLGLGSNEAAENLRVVWPDYTLQCEMNVVGDRRMELIEHNRKTGSCPVLFTWNGSRFECLGDFLGGGGLGYLVAPGVYGVPDRDEAVAISSDQLRPVSGVYRLSVTEPMDELAYLDQLLLEVVDRPPGVATTPDERFAPEGPRPTGELLAWRETIEPVQARDEQGRDVAETLRAFDRRTVDGFARRPMWIGYARDHAIELDFGDKLARFGPHDELILCLAGWVEYPYSQTNYAAATAGVALRPPVLERRGDDGVWRVLEPHLGYPAGLPRLMTHVLVGKLNGPRCVLRITTNMECYWDQAFVAVRDRKAEVRATTLAVARAELRDRGYTREASPDGRMPLSYDYDHVDAAPLARFRGKLTRYGDVAALVRRDDDRLCVVGPGDELRLEFDAEALPALPAGWTRAFVLRSVGYCKDADPFTALSDTVGPLPWRGMPPFPFGPAGERPAEPDFDAYLLKYQTRPAGVP
ncbi:MAG: VCBS repeat-containing protein [Planctomycetota bacterium]|nr:VCBS repeat-containing protein [Planctomycetota bacterium]